ncbi:hypothetical protein AVEN_154822-1 [Araneus ventricosus]|uniref:Uncharacterized protein n=1 Tax=Araneus ventricosus TaxID=182803 RepID=A0A4Y2BUL4_ARAVE|nr:hypothetical protein AVEN_154822-1 [Araneus ventricosus]
MQDNILIAEYSNPDLYAMASNDADRWKQTTDEEMNSLKQNEILDMVELPQGKFSIEHVDRTPPHAPVPDAITSTETVVWTWDEHVNSKKSNCWRPDYAFERLHLQRLCQELGLRVGTVLFKGEYK